ncbi:MAG: threonine--tRNA ligase, partial [Candidatus Bathyarchaeia archaeon]
PLSELSRTITPSKHRKLSPEVTTFHKILERDMKLHDPSSYTFSANQKDLQAVVEKEALKKELKGGKEPLYLKYCRKFGIQWEPYSDVGHMRYNPEAALLFDLVSDYARALVNSIGIPVFHVRGTNLFDLSVPAVREHADLYGGRLYQVDIDEKSYVLRYAACHQQFAMVKDWILSYKDLPMGAFEIADSYRMEQDGELLLCFRLRKLHMPDLHIFCKDIDEAERVSLDVHKKIYAEIQKLGLDYVSLYNTTERYFKEHPDFFKNLLEIERKPVLVNFVPDRYYWTINIEYNIVDELQRPREIGTFQIDVGNAKRFDITYTNEKGAKLYPPIVHTALIGTIERYLFAVFDAVAKDELAGKPTILPLWLSPTQVRLVPISKQFFAFADKVADLLENADIRVDLDDIEETLSKKIRRAETSWIPFVAVVGKKEEATEKMAVRIRQNGENRELTLEEIIAQVKKETGGYPRRPLPFPRYLSRRPGYKTD